MRNFTRLAIFSTLATYFLIFIGGLVRVSGAGLGCPDWPKCFDSWIPPLNISQLPSGIDPNTFNFTLAWIEYFNRIMGVGLGILILSVTVWALVSYNKEKKILWPALAAGVLLVFQAWHGGQVVATELEPLVVSVHLLIALLLASLMIYISLQSYYLDQNLSPTGSSNSRFRKLIGVVWLLSIIQVVLGTQFREAIENAIRNYPLEFGSALLANVGLVKYFHPLFGIGLTAMIIFAVIKMLKSNSGLSSLTRQGLISSIGLCIVLLIIGMVLVTAGIPPVFQVLHMWVASLIVGSTILVYIDLGRAGEV